MGNETAQTYSDVGRFSYERDVTGRVAAAHLPSGLSTFNEYDKRGAFIKQSDNRGNAVTVQRDAGGAPIAYIRGDGKQMRAVRDDVGRVIRDTDFDGNVRTFAYDARGGLTDSTVRGKHRKYEYDHRGRLSAIVADDGGTRKVERDERGQIRRLSYPPIASLSPFKLQAAPFRSLVDRRWAHAPALQDPPPDCCDDPIMTDIWAPYWPTGPGGGGGEGGHPPLQGVDGEGGTGGGLAETRQQCIARHIFNCNLGFAACLLGATGVFIGTFAGCSLTTFLAGAPACEVLADIVLVLVAGGCVIYGAACMNAVQDGCPS